jgi:hypothetical protein
MAICRCKSDNRNRMKKLLISQFDRLARRAGRQILHKRTDSYDVIEVARIKAAYDSAVYYEKHMIEARSFTTDLNLLSHAVSISPPDGLFLEFGVATGRTISHIASLHEGPVYGFDSFEGLPNGWRTGFEVGHFAGAMPRLPSNVHLISGWFLETLPSFVQTHSGPVSFIHVDCDLYSSTKVIFDLIGERLREGSVIVFDEYFNYPGWQNHEFKAFQELIDCRSLRYRYEALVPSHQQVCVVIQR